MFLDTLNQVGCRAPLGRFSSPTEITNNLDGNEPYSAKGFENLTRAFTTSVGFSHKPKCMLDAAGHKARRLEY